MRDKISGEWKKLHNAKLHALYSLPNMIRNLKSRRLWWAEHVAHMEKSRNKNRVLKIPDKIELEIENSENGLILDECRNMLNKRGYWFERVKNGIREMTKKRIGDENKNTESNTGKTKITVDRLDKVGPTRERTRMYNNHEQRMLGG